MNVELVRVKNDILARVTYKTRDRKTFSCLLKEANFIPRFDDIIMRSELERMSVIG